VPLKACKRNCMFFVWVPKSSHCLSGLQHLRRICQFIAAAESTRGSKCWCVFDFCGNHRIFELIPSIAIETLWFNILITSFVPFSYSIILYILIVCDVPFNYLLFESIDDFSIVLTFNLHFKHLIIGFYML